MDSTQTLFNKRLRKLTRGFFFASPSFGGKSKPNASSQHDHIVQKCLSHILIFEHVGEYSQTTHVLALLSLAFTSFDTTSTLIALHLKSNGYFPLLLKDYGLDQDLQLSFNSFKLTLQLMLYLLASGPFGMVFEHFQITIHLEDSIVDSFNCFNFVFILHKVTFHFELHESLERPTF
jgi:hypothetical protein